GGRDRERVGEVVDVFRGAEDVHDLRQLRQDGGRAEPVWGGGEAALEEIFDRFDVVAGLGLDRRHLADLAFAERRDDFAQVRDFFLGEFWCSGQRPGGREVDEPFHLHLEAGPVEGRFGEVVDERGGGGAVTPVERAEGNSGGGRSAVHTGHGTSVPVLRARPRGRCL